MQPCLLLALALALLGTACAGHHAPGSPEAAGAALEVPQDGDDDDRCPLESEQHALSVRDPLSAATLRYVIVTRCKTFLKAERVCSRCYRGRLASIHSLRVNRRLQRRARACTNQRQLWIGATTRPLGFKVWCKWVDRTHWNFSFWLLGNPLRSHRYCTSLCTANGRWRSQNCHLRLPFICEY